MRLVDANTVAQQCQGEWINGAPSGLLGPAVVFDSRQVQPGAIFVALRGERVDGHNYLAAAREKGAAAAIVGQPVEDPLPQLLVQDQVEALTRLARACATWERERGLRTVGITGSSGKTTTKDLLAQIMESQGPTVSPEGSFNNELGMPITTLKCDQSTQWFVCELGAQRRGEIAHLCSIAKPQVSVVLNVGHAHLGEFGSIEAIVEAKREIVQALDRDGVAVLNCEDPRVWGMKDHAGTHIVATAVDQEPDYPTAVWAHALTADRMGRCSFLLCSRGLTALGGIDGQAEVRLQIPGKHVAADAVAAAAAAMVLGVSADAAAAALTLAMPRSRWRMALSDLPNGALLVNDAYNANPDSVAAALAALETLVAHRRTTHPGARSWVVLGDMLELGEESDALHIEVGRLAREADEVLAVGEFAAQIVAGAGKGRAVCNAEAARDILDSEVRPADIILLKGSNGTGLGLLGDALAAGQGEGTR